MGAFFDGNPYRAPFSELRATIAALWEGRPEEIPTDEHDFAIWLRKEILWLSQLPRDAMFDLYREASEDLATIELNIERCQRENTAIGKRPKTDHDGLDEKLYEYYRRMNSAARDEILQVLRGGLENEALRRSERRFEHLLPAFDFHVAWSFRWFTDRFNPESISDLANKFGGLAITDLEQAEQLFKTDLAQFDVFLDQYFEIHSPVRHVREVIPKHHRLVPRKKVLEAALGAFERGEFDLFTATTALQVEGIFEDCCLDLGVKQEDLLIQTLVPKLDALKRAGGRLTDYAYYAFRFPIVRNRIAHGRVLPGDGARTARLLLLDLLDVCDILRSLPLVTNRAVQLLESIPRGEPTMKDLVKFASLIEPHGRIPPLDPCYQLAELLAQMEASIQSQAFWTFLSSLAELTFPNLHSGIKKIAIALKNAPNSRSKDLLRTVGSADETVGRYDPEEFWELVDASDLHPPNSANGATMQEPQH